MLNWSLTLRCLLLPQGFEGPKKCYAMDYNKGASLIHIPRPGYQVSFSLAKDEN